MAKIAQEQEETQQEMSSEEAMSVDGKGEKGQNQNQEVNSDGQGSGEVGEATTSFKNPILQGKTPEEIEALFEAQQNAIKSQNTELNSYHSRLAAVEQERAVPPKKEETDEEVYGDNFLAPTIKKLEERLSTRLEQMVKPLIQSTQKTQVTTTREKLRKDLTHFSVLEEHIDQFLRQNKMDPETVNEQQLRTLYYQVVGLANEQGLNLGGRSSSNQPAAVAIPESDPRETQNQNQDPQMIPQRRPSSSPLPSRAGGKPAKRQLTEDERILARHSNMTDDQFLEFQDMDIEEVVKPGFSKDEW